MMNNGVPTQFRRSETTRVKDAVQALALCHNVTPTYESDNHDSGKPSSVVKGIEIESICKYFRFNCFWNWSRPAFAGPFHGSDLSSVQSRWGSFSALDARSRPYSFPERHKLHATEIPRWPLNELRHSAEFSFYEWNEANGDHCKGNYPESVLVQNTISFSACRFANKFFTTFHSLRFTTFTPKQLKIALVTRPRS